jgi:hypothetical protein
VSEVIELPRAETAPENKPDKKPKRCSTVEV